MNLRRRTVRGANARAFWGTAAFGVLVGVILAFAHLVPGVGRSGAGGPSAAARDSGEKARVKGLLGKLPLYFVENGGQEDPRVAFSVPGRDTTVYFTPGGVTFALSSPSRGGPERGLTRLSAPKAKSASRERWAVRLDFVGANPAVVPGGQDSTPATVNYFTGPASQWKTGLKTYSSVVYADLWPGIDLVYSGTSGRLKYTLFVKPGADPGQVRFAYSGASTVRLTEAGQLAVSTPVGGFTDDRPYAYQEVGGRQREVSMAYDLADDRLARDRAERYQSRPSLLVNCNV